MMNIGSIGSIGLNTGLIVAIVGLCEFIKKLDNLDKFKKFYIFLPLVFSIVASLFMSTGGFKAISLNTFIYFGVSTLAYKTVLRAFLSKKK